jgi:UDP-glucose 4-epimerase
MQKALVTGGAGFIGSHLARALLQQGVSVKVFDNFSTGKKENLAGAIGSLNVIEGDIRDSIKAAEAVDGVDVIFHEAAFVSVPQSMADPMLCFDVNQRGTETIFEAARKHGVKRIVIASSAAVYGDAEIQPIVESSPLHPASPYGLSKRVDELYAELYTQTFGVNVVALRYFNVFGPRQRPDSQYAAAVPIFVKRMIDNKPITIYGDGKQTRDLVFVGDVVRANLIAAEHPSAPGEVFNVCTGHEISILDLVNTLREMFPSAPMHEFAPARSGDIYRSIGSPAKSAQVIGFHAQTNLADGLRQTVEWMRS